MKRLLHDGLHMCTRACRPRAQNEVRSELSESHFTNFTYLKKEAQTHSGNYDDSVRPKILKPWAVRGILAKRIELRVASFE